MDNGAKLPFTLLLCILQMNMKILVLGCLLLMCACLRAQPVSYPDVLSRSKSAEGFIPAGWHILNERHGDLNNDTLDDIALVLERNDSVLQVTTLEGHEPTPWDSVVYRPRILVVAFYMAAEKQYRLMLQHNTFIINTTYRCL